MTISNSIDDSSPSIDFKFINDCVLGDGVPDTDDGVYVGCGQVSAPGRAAHAGLCRPDMGQGIGCEFAQICECLEYAAVNEAKLSAEQKARYEANPDDTAGLPKVFPYFGPRATKKGCLVGFYLNSRNPIYECNRRCKCGPDCKSRLVQKGRTVPLEIFKTADRGWGALSVFSSLAPVFPPFSPSLSNPHLRFPSNHH